MDYGRMVKKFAYNAAENIPNFVCVLLPSLVVHEFCPQSLKGKTLILDYPCL